MTSMLLSASMVEGAAGVALRPPVVLFLSRLLDVLSDHVLVGSEPLGALHELAALHLPDLHEPAALVVGRRDLEGGHQATEGEVADLLEALLGILAGDLAVRLGLEGVADGLDVKRRD